MPPPFWDVPTDAEYAMELISQRVAAGLDVTPARKRKKSDVTESADVTSRSEKNSSSQGNSSSSVDWKKWGNRVAIGKSAVSDIKRLRPGSPVGHRLIAVFFYSLGSDLLCPSGWFTKCGLLDTLFLQG